MKLRLVKSPFSASKNPSKETDMNTGKLCSECGKTMCENFINHGSCAWGASRIWNDHVEPRDKQIAALQEEIRQLKEGMGGVVNWIQKVGVDNAIRGSVIIEMIEELMRR